MRALLSLLVAAAATLVAATAHAGDFEVQPSTVALAGKHNTGSVTVVNRGATATRFQVKVVRWSEGEDGHMGLVESKDVVAYPSLFTIDAGGSKAIRIGTTVAPGAVEQTWRVLVEELPAPPSDSGSAIHMLTRMSIPVFLPPTKTVVDGSIDGTLVAGKLTFTVHNRGTTRFRTATVRYVGQRVSGTVDFDRSQAGWYVLAGGQRRYEIELSRTECLPLDRIKLEAVSDAGTFTATIAVTPTACGTK